MVTYTFDKSSFRALLASGTYGKVQLGSATCASSVNMVDRYLSNTVLIRQSILNQTSYSLRNLNTYTDTQGTATPNFDCGNMYYGTYVDTICNDDNSPYTCGDCDPLNLLDCQSPPEAPSQSSMQVNFKYTRKCHTWVDTSTSPPSSAGEEFCYGGGAYGWYSVDAPATSSSHLDCPAGYDIYPAGQYDGCYSNGYTPSPTPPAVSAGSLVCGSGGSSSYRTSSTTSNIPYFWCWSTSGSIFGAVQPTTYGGYGQPWVYGGNTPWYTRKDDTVQTIVLILGLMIVVKEATKLLMMITIPFTDVVRKHPGRFKYCLTSPFGMLLLLKSEYRELIRLTFISQDATWPTLIDLVLEDGKCS